MQSATSTEKADTELVSQTPPEVDIWTLEPEGDVDGSREKKAHAESIALVPEFDNYGYVGKRGSDSYTVFSASGSEYTTGSTGGCNCMDAKMNSPENGCKHNQRLIIELNRGLIPVPDTPVDEWMETKLYDQIITAAEHCAALEDAQQAAERVEEPEYDPSDYDDPIETTATILTGLHGEYERYREDVNPDAPELPEVVRSNSME